MAWSFTRDNDTVEGDLRWSYGTYTSTGGTTGGVIYTGLQRVYGMLLQQKSDAVVATQPKVNATAGTPTADGITIITIAAGTGFWMAFGA